MATVGASVSEVSPIPPALIEVVRTSPRAARTRPFSYTEYLHDYSEIDRIKPLVRKRIAAGLPPYPQEGESWGVE